METATANPKPDAGEQLSRRDLFRCCYVVAGLRRWPGVAPDQGDLTLLACTLAAVLDGNADDARIFARALVLRRAGALAQVAA